MVKKILIYLFIVTASLNAQNIEVSAYTDSTQYFVGDYIKYSIDLKYDKSIKVEFPNIKDSLKQLEFINELPKFQNEVNGKIIETRSFNFSYYDSAQVTIQSFPIRYLSNGEKLVINTNPVTVTVKAIPTNPQAEIKDIKAPVRIPFDWLTLLIIILLAIIILAAVYFIYKKYFKKSEDIIAKKIVVIPPHETALNHLRKIEEEKLWQKGLIKEFHSEITNVVRKYFEERFSFAALEMPSSEIIPQLNKIKECKSVIDISRDFFENADLVKFAKFQPMPSVNENMLKLAFDIVIKTKPNLIESEIGKEENADV
ncbi:MAG: hypothetical protein K8F60_19025 [Melioribacteraceae bacterium]|nr:hypothetical protein [Melioribacteraceae bacterium]